jgi:hypothetical protein
VIQLVAIWSSGIRMRKQANQYGLRYDRESQMSCGCVVSADLVVTAPHMHWSD